MKIYRSITIDFVSGNTVTEDSYEYSGPVAECKGENKIFKQQQGQSFTNVGNFTNQQQNFFNSLNTQMAQRFGEQSAVFKQLSTSLGKVSGGGPGQYKFGGNQPPVDPTLPPGPNVRPGPNGAGGNQGQGGGQGTGAPTDPFAGANFQSLYNAKMFQGQFLPSGTRRAESVARAQASEDVAKRYADAQTAFGARAQQLGGYGGGTEAAGLQNLQGEQASQEAQAQREVLLAMQQQQHERALGLAPYQTQLQLGAAQAYGEQAQAHNQREMAKIQMAQQAAAQKRAAAAQAGASRNAAAAQRSAAQQMSQQFAEEMKLRGAQLSSDNYFRSIGALHGLSQSQNPLGYGELGGQQLGSGSGAWQNLYGTGSQGMVATRSNPVWQSLLGSALGGVSAFATGGMSALGGNMFGGASKMGNYPTGPSYWG